MKKLISKHILSDMQLLYILDSERGTTGLCIAPSDAEIDIDKERQSVQSLAEYKIIGDKYPGDYFGGLSMKYSESTEKLRFDDQKVIQSGGETKIETYLKSEDNMKIIHTVTHKQNRQYITVSTEFVNGSDKAVTLEMLSSFAICGISPFIGGAGENSLRLHRLRSKWSMEGRLVTENLEDLMLEDSWCYVNSFNLRFGQAGSMPVKDYFPFAAVEDAENHVIWGSQLCVPSSWQTEITRCDYAVCMSGGISDREFGHWTKTVPSGGSFSDCPAVLSVCRGGIDDISARLVSAQDDNLDIPPSEEDLPIIFNEYCTTWGNPSHENICNILNAIDGMDIDYFVIDCGWYKTEGVPWHCSMGDYEQSKSLFPDGISETAKLINSHGMRAGIWFEFETVGKKANAYSKTEMMLKRDGVPLTTKNRRFWDMRDERVTEYLKERVIDFMKDNGFSYIKVDYNETIGIGCDNADSLGEGLRQNIEASQEFFKKIRREIPDVIIENCSSGGNRLEPSFMALSSMASFSDAHECVEIPIIAANLHRAILPRQSQIWCVIRKSDSVRRINYSISATFLGRLCLSGDVTDLSQNQTEAIKDGIAFYRKAADFIKSGKSRILQNMKKSHRHPEGYQAVIRENENGALLVIHTFKNAPSKISIPVGDYKIADTYPEICAKISKNTVTVKPDGDFCGMGIVLNKR